MGISSISQIYCLYNLKTIEFNHENLMVHGRLIVSKSVKKACCNKTPPEAVGFGSP